MEKWRYEKERIERKADAGLCFETEDRSISIPVTVENETVWLNQSQMIELFGREKDKSFKGRIGNIYQSFGGTDVYKTLGGKAANLLYYLRL